MNTCKDVEFARRVVAQMKDGRFGRTPSMRRDAQSPRYDVPKVGEKWGVPPDAQPISNIGLFGNHFIFASPEECGVGDLVPVENACSHDGEWYRVRIIHHRIDGSTDEEPERLFKRLSQRLTPDGGVTWKEESFWQRVS